MKKGFTLMEIVAVILVLAVIASFLVPVVKSVTKEVRYHQAKIAGIKMAEAIRIFYKDSKGHRINESVTGGNLRNLEVSSNPADSNSCKNPAVSGIPSDFTAAGTVDVMQLFYCNYLSAKDFAELNYTFNPGACQGEAECLVEVSDDERCFRVLRNSSIVEGTKGVTECQYN